VNVPTVTVGGATSLCGGNTSLYAGGFTFTSAYAGG